MKFLPPQMRTVPRTQSVATAWTWIQGTPLLTRQTDLSPCLHSMDTRVSSFAFKVPRICTLSEVKVENYFLNLEDRRCLDFALPFRMEVEWGPNKYVVEAYSYQEYGPAVR